MRINNRLLKLLIIFSFGSFYYDTGKFGDGYFYDFYLSIYSLGSTPNIEYSIFLLLFISPILFILISFFNFKHSKLLFRAGIIILYILALIFLLFSSSTNNFYKSLISIIPLFVSTIIYFKFISPRK
jgi:hypothetical protein